MAKLPNADRAIIDPRKISDYLLAPTHMRGGSKAGFLAAFGFTKDHPAFLIEALIQHAQAHAIADTQSSSHGAKYIIDGPLQTPGGRNPNVRSVWIIDAGADFCQVRNSVSGSKEQAMTKNTDRKIDELDVVALVRDRPGERLAAGDLGTVVMAYADGKAYEVEFISLTGETIALLTLEAGEVRPVKPREIAHVREVA